MFLSFSPFLGAFSLPVNCHQSKQYIHSSYGIIIAYICHPISREPILPVGKGFFHYKLLYHPVSRANPKVYPPIPPAEPIVPFLLVKIIISQFLSDQTVYPIILRHHHSQHSSPHQQRAYFTSQRGLLHYQFLSHPISRYKITVYPPTHQKSLLSPFCW